MAGWALALVFTSALVIACNNEAEDSQEPAADTPAVVAPPATDTLPAVDTTATSRPDGSTTGGIK